jgi:hypothetical protein
MKKQLPAKAKTPAIFNQLLKLPKIEPHHVSALSPQQQIEFRQFLAQKLMETKDVERDAFLEKVEAIVEADKIWEYNHARIIRAIEQYVKQFAAMPTKSVLADATGLSRQTIHKHIQQFTHAPAAEMHREIAIIMKEQVLHKVLQAALAGDVSAAKLYLQASTHHSNNNTVTIHNQNNYIQINGTVLNQRVIEQLNPQQLTQLEKTIKKCISENKA